MIPARDLRLAFAWTLALLAALAALGLTLGFVVGPQAMAQGALWQFVGLDAPTCPGCGLCGMSRAFAALGHGRLVEAVEHNRLALVAWPLTWLVALGGPIFLVRTLTPRSRPCRSPR